MRGDPHTGVVIHRAPRCVDSEWSPGCDPAAFVSTVPSTLRTLPGTRGRASHGAAETAHGDPADVSEDLETPETQAGEYVLGTLRGPELARFEEALAGDPVLQRLVRTWESRFEGLAAAVPAQAPAPRAWRRVAARIERRAPSGGGRALGLWRALAVAATAAAIALGLFTLRAGDGLAPVHVALLVDASAQPAFFVSTPSQGGELQIRLLRPPATPSDRALELWLLPPGGKPPRSLGLLERDGPTELRVPPEDARALSDGAGLAVSEEPPGGSPTGAPTGPVLFSGALHRAL